MATLLSLPYDVRHAIYQQLFPRGDQIYIQAFDTGLRSLLPDDSATLAIAKTCHQLRDESLGYIYNNYLFNLIGNRSHVLDHYKPFLHSMREYALHRKIRIDTFTNGIHSSTICMSLQSGSTKVRVLEQRQRGEKTPLHVLLAKDRRGRKADRLHRQHQDRRQRGQGVILLAYGVGFMVHDTVRDARRAVKRWSGRVRHFFDWLVLRSGML